MTPHAKVREAYLLHMRTLAGKLRDLERAAGSHVPALAALADAQRELQAAGPEAFACVMLGEARRRKALGALVAARAVIAHTFAVLLGAAFVYDDADDEPDQPPALAPPTLDGVGAFLRAELARTRLAA